MTTGSYMSHLECGLCGTRYDADVLQTTCTADSRPLLARYDLERARRELDRDAISTRPPGLWRCRELLPVRDESKIVTLGEGSTPLVPLRGLGERLGAPRLLGKDEGRNPTGSFKARGMAVAVSRAWELGATSLAAPSAGNAGAALAAYAVRAGLPAIVAMPSDAPESARVQTERYGARLILVQGLISDAGAEIRRIAAEEGAFDVSTLREPYRAEGKKTMGYELAEALGWRLPDVIVYPAGGGTGIVGMWKAFAELEALGWLDDARRPRLVLVQSTGCAPLVRAWESGERFAQPWSDAHTIAHGLRVPGAVGDFLILDAVRESGGCAVAVDDETMVQARRDLAGSDGLDVSNESAATVVAYERLVADGVIERDAEAVLFLTGSGLLE